MGRTLYAILGVDQNASTEQICTAFNAESGKLDPADTIRQMAIKEAWETLSKPERRARYDASLRAIAMATSEQHFHDDAESAGAGKLVIAGLILILLAGGGYWLHKRNPKSSEQPKPQVEIKNLPAAPANNDTARNDGAMMPSPSKPLSSEALFAQASASIVRVNVMATSDTPIRFGSGVITERGGVITNCHVALGGGQLQVVHQSGTFNASVSVADEEHDLCKLDVSGLNAPPVAVGKASSLSVGQKVYAIGSPQGLDLTLSDGMVSSLRNVKDGTLIQTTAPVSPGSSGGGLFNEFGQLVGIVTFQSARGQNLNFAIPADWISSMSNTSASSSLANNETMTPPVPDTRSRMAMVVGTWHCYGPLTGRGLEVVFTDNGVFHGELDGRPVGGSYAIYGKSFNFGGDNYDIEELSATRLVMSKGSGRRIICSR